MGFGQLESPATSPLETKNVSRHYHQRPEICPRDVKLAIYNGHLELLECK